MRMPPCAWSGEQCVHLDSRCCLAVSCVYVMASEGEMAGFGGFQRNLFSPVSRVWQKLVLHVAPCVSTCLWSGASDDS